MSPEHQNPDRTHNPPSTQLTHTNKQSIGPSDLIIRSSPKQCLVSEKAIRVTMGQKGWRQNHLSLPLPPLVFGCHQALHVGLQSTHLEREANSILPAGTKPLAPLFSLLVSSIFPLLSLGIYFKPPAFSSVLSEAGVCMRETQQLLSLHPHASRLSILVRQTFWLACRRPPHHYIPECA